MKNFHLESLGICLKETDQIEKLKKNRLIDMTTATIRNRCVNPYMVLLDLSFILYLLNKKNIL